MHEPEPVLQEDVDKLTDKIRELELENTQLRVQLSRTKQQNYDLEDKDPLNPTVKRVNRAWISIVRINQECGKKNILAKKPYILWVKEQTLIIKMPFLFDFSSFPLMHEPEPVLQEDVDKLTDKIRELELENTQLRVQLSCTKQQNYDLEDKDPLNPTVKRVNRAWISIVRINQECGKKKILAKEPYILWVKAQTLIIKMPFLFDFSSFPLMHEPEPVLQEDVDKLTDKIRELELENTQLRVQLSRTKLQNYDLEDKGK
ncbi:hypothetical protein KIW84_076589 [Lathyrus oleraceus]|uniref:Uncharacterized protein n=1 Tax=Pisum sativum TaxID=3888 RepID=A0A9D5A1C5_PEA|nr:hypothetical protein KIW84_076589 [Pisum sativum]